MYIISYFILFNLVECGFSCKMKSQYSTKSKHLQKKKLYLQIITLAYLLGFLDKEQIHSHI